MQIGDLVELSAYGKKLTCNYSQQGSVGVVVGVDGPDYYPVRPTTAISVQWVRAGRVLHQIRRDLRYVR